MQNNTVLNIKNEESTGSGTKPYRLIYLNVLVVFKSAAQGLDPVRTRSNSACMYHGFMCHSYFTFSNCLITMFPIPNFSLDCVRLLGVARCVCCITCTIFYSHCCIFFVSSAVSISLLSLSSVLLSIGPSVRP